MKHLKRFNEEVQLKTNSVIKGFIQSSYAKYPRNKALRMLYFLLYDDDKWTLVFNNLRREMKTLHDEIVVSPEGTEKKVIIKVGRLIRKYAADNSKVMNLEITDRDIEEFVNIYKSFFSEIKNIKIVSGSDIKYWYNRDNYSPDSDETVLGNSCMAGPSCQSYFKIYTENPDVCRLVIQTDKNNKLIARALLWKLKDGRELLDRIYSLSDYQSIMFKDWVKENIPNSIHVEELDDKVEVQLSKWKFQEYPYVDNMYYLDYNTGILTNVRDYNAPYYTISSTYGDYSTPYNWQYIEDEDVYVPTKDAIYDKFNRKWIRKQPEPKSWIDKFKDFKKKIWK